MMCFFTGFLDISGQSLSFRALKLYLALDYVKSVPPNNVRKTKEEKHQLQGQRKHY